MYKYSGCEDNFPPFDKKFEKFNYLETVHVVGKLPYKPDNKKVYLSRNNSDHNVIDGWTWA